MSDGSSPGGLSWQLERVVVDSGYRVVGLKTPSDRILYLVH